MIIPILKLIFGKVVGLDSIPAERRSEYWRKLGAYSKELVGEIVRESAKGAAEGIRDGKNS